MVAGKRLSGQDLSRVRQVRPGRKPTWAATSGDDDLLAEVVGGLCSADGLGIVATGAKRGQGEVGQWNVVNGETAGAVDGGGKNWRTRRGAGGGRSAWGRRKR
jgi:hypothetical protein